jgi:hypothetical protein
MLLIVLIYLLKVKALKEIIEGWSVKGRDLKFWFYFLRL